VPEEIAYIAQSEEEEEMNIYTDQNYRKIWRKTQKNFPNFLKRRIFLSKLANYSPISTKIFSF